MGNLFLPLILSPGCTGTCQGGFVNVGVFVGGGPPVSYSATILLMCKILLSDVTCIKLTYL